MTPQETRAIVSLSLLAAFADGEKHERERAEIKRIAEGLSADESLQGPSLYQDVLMKRVSIASVASELGSLESRQLAYEMAVCVCDADGVQSVLGQRFPDEVRAALAIAAPAAATHSRSAEELAALPLAASGTVAVAPLPSRAAPDNAELDRGHVKGFLATAGVGMTSQFIEQAGRKLLGGLLGKLGGGLGRGLGNQAVSSGMSFASTYALGHVAKRYHADGWQLETAMLKEAYASVVSEARNLQTQYLPAMQDKARTLDAGKVIAMVRGA